MRPGFSFGVIDGDLAIDIIDMQAAGYALDRDIALVHRRNIEIHMVRDLDRKDQVEVIGDLLPVTIATSSFPTITVATRSGIEGRRNIDDDRVGDRVKRQLEFLFTEVQALAVVGREALIH